MKLSRPVDGIKIQNEKIRLYFSAMMVHIPAAVVFFFSFSGPSTINKRRNTSSWIIIQNSSFKHAHKCVRVLIN